MLTNIVLARATSLALRTKRQCHLTNAERVTRYPNLNCPDFQVSKVDDKKGTALLRHPGFSYGDYDATGNLTTWRILQFLSSVHYFLKLQKEQPIRNILRNKMIQDAAQHVVCLETLFQKEMFDDNIPKKPLYVSIGIPYTGNTSYLFESTLYNDIEMRNKLLVCVARIVNLNETTLKPIPLHASKKYDEADSRPLMFETLSKPERTLLYETTIGFSDIGPRGRSHYFSFSKLALDAVYHEVISRKLEGFPHIFLNGVRRIRQLHKMEGVFGDRIQIYVWQNCKGSKIYHCDITTRNVYLCQCTIEFF